MAAELVQEVYKIFDPAPLPATETDLYVSLDDVRGNAGIVDKLANRIRLSGKPTCQILAGHRGSGKSTELYRLQRTLQEKAQTPPYFVVYCEARHDIDLNDVDFPELMIGLLRQIAAQVKKNAGITLKAGYFKDRFEFLKRFLGSEVTFDAYEVEVGMLKLSGVIKNSPDARQKLREALEPDTNNWIWAANELIGTAKLELTKKGYRDLVVIVDDLDRMIDRPHGVVPCSTCEHLFVRREAQLTAFLCHFVYTMPISCVYSGMAATIENLYGGQPPVVPMTKLTTRPPEAKPFKPGIQKFRDIITKRLAKAQVDETQVFNDAKVRDELVKLSGGQPRELMILIREAILGTGLPIDAPAVERAAREGRRSYARQLMAEHWPIIEAVRRNGTLGRTTDNDKAIRELLESRAILSYVNDEDWYGENPLLAGLKNPFAAEASP